MKPHEGMILAKKIKKEKRKSSNSLVISHSNLVQVIRNTRNNENYELDENYEFKQRHDFTFLICPLWC